MSRAAFLPFVFFVLLFVAAGPTLGPTFGQDASVLDDDERAAIDSYMNEMLDAHRIPGMVLAVVRDGAVVHSAGYGRSGLTAEDGSARAMLPDTPVRIGSATASFTALALLQLAERGEVDLDVPVSTYLPSFAGLDETTDRPVTVRHLLSHTSGMPPAAALWAGDAGAGAEGADEDGAAGPAADTAIRRRADAIAAAVARRGTEAQPGEAFVYADANFIVAGAVLEAAAGRPYAGYVREELLGPLGLDGCFMPPGDELGRRGTPRATRGGSSTSPWRSTPRLRRARSRPRGSRAAPRPPVATSRPCLAPPPPRPPLCRPKYSPSCGGPGLRLTVPALPTAPPTRTDGSSRAAAARGMSGTPERSRPPRVPITCIRGRRVGCSWR